MLSVVNDAEWLKEFAVAMAENWRDEDDTIKREYTVSSSSDDDPTDTANGDHGSSDSDRDSSDGDQSASDHDQNRSEEDPNDRDQDESEKDPNDVDQDESEQDPNDGKL